MLTSNEISDEKVHKIKAVLYFSNIIFFLPFFLSFFFLIINFNHMLYIMTKNDIVK